MGFGINIFLKKINKSIYALKNEFDFGRRERIWVFATFFIMKITSSNEKFASLLTYVQPINNLTS